MTASGVSVELCPASRADVPELLELERLSFSTDRLGAMQFRRFIASPRAALLVARTAGSTRVPAKTLAGYVLILFRLGSRKARIYSIAVAGNCRGMGIGEQLLRRGESVAAARGSLCVRLEVRPDNAAALAMYAKNGYQPFGRYARFYEDGTDAIRLEKMLG